MNGMFTALLHKMGPLLNSSAGIEDTRVGVPKERETNKDAWCEVGSHKGIWVLKMFFTSLTAAPMKYGGANREDRASSVVAGDSAPNRGDFKTDNASRNGAPVSDVPFKYWANQLFISFGYALLLLPAADSAKNTYFWKAYYMMDREQQEENRIAWRRRAWLWSNILLSSSFWE